jgi:hypothetical protein
VFPHNCWLLQDDVLLQLFISVGVLQETSMHCSSAFNVRKRVCVQ